MAKTPKPAKKPTGRPSLYTEELAAAICERVSAGECLEWVCAEPGMPAVRTWNEWIERKPELSADFARARARGHDAIAADALKIADDATNDWMERNGADSPGWALNGEHVQRSKLRIETRLKLLAKWDKRYGDKLAIGGSDDMPPIKTMSDEQLRARIEALGARLDADQSKKVSQNDTGDGDA